MKKPSKAQLALEVLSRGPLDAYQLYKKLWPEGDGGCNSAKGGPSGSECAVHWLLGRANRKYAAILTRREMLTNAKGRAVAQGRIFITEAGRQVLASAGKVAR